MKKKGRGYKETLNKLKRNAVVLAVIAIMAVCSVIVVRGILLDNAKRMGSEMANSYSLESERSMIAYEAMMRLSCEYIDRQLQTSDAPEEWIRSFLETVSAALGANVIDPYAVIDGKIIAANPWEGDEDYAVEDAEWYNKAVEANGEVIFTDGYIDAISGKTVITIAQEVSVPGDVVAFDIFPEQFRIDERDNRLPEGSAYFLCDSTGKLLYGDTELDVSGERLQRYIDEIVSKIEDGSFECFDAYIHSPGGEKFAAYYDIAENGWISIITIPYNSLLGGVRTISIWYIGIILIFLAVFIAMSIRENHMNRNIVRTNETVRVLGNSYYAIYRMDFSNERYEMIKGSDYMRSKIPAEGDYNLLLSTMGELMRPEVFEEFRRSFSIENVRRLVSQRTRDYGGDFQRLFGDEYRWVNVRLLFDESLNPEEAVLCFKEVDEEKRAQLRQIQLLKESLKAARESEESKNSFFSRMSHDMRTPLNAIIGLSELAEMHTDKPESLKDDLKKINYSSQQLLELINDILEMSRLENGKITLENKHFNLRQCVSDCADIFRTRAEKEGKVVSVDFEIETENVYGDSFRLTQILNNLMSNAVKFSSPGDSIDLSVKELERGEYTKYRFIVKDTGAGMSREFMDKLFTPYERETRFGAKYISGTGLGMPIVKSLVSQMNGEISVESELGKGSVFTITLPFKGVNQENDNSENEERGENDTEFLRGKKILLAEDNEINMDIACELLAMYGCEAVKAWNGREAVDIFEKSAEFEFDAFLMDMQMPEMDGCEAAQTIRKTRRGDAKTIPIIAVTANAFAEDLAATAAAGMDAHISKPIDFKVLCKTLAELTKNK